MSEKIPYLPSEFDAHPHTVTLPRQATYCHFSLAMLSTQVRSTHETHEKTWKHTISLDFHTWHTLYVPTYSLYMPIYRHSSPSISPQVHSPQDETRENTPYHWTLTPWHSLYVWTSRKIQDYAWQCAKPLEFDAHPHTVTLPRYAIPFLQMPTQVHSPHETHETREENMKTLSQDSHIMTFTLQYVPTYLLYVPTCRIPPQVHSPHDETHKKHTISLNSHTVLTFTLCADVNSHRTKRRRSDLLVEDASSL